MSINAVLLKNSDGKKSVTMTAFVLGYIVVNAKLLLSGITIAGLQISVFSGMEYAAAMGALGAVYVMRRKDNVKGGEKK